MFEPNPNTILDCIDTLSTEGGKILNATAFLFENTKPSQYEWNIVNNVTVSKAGNPTENIEIGGTWINAEGVEMPSNTYCLTIILPDDETTNKPYIVDSQEITIDVFNFATQEVKEKTYNLVIVLPD